MKRLLQFIKLLYRKYKRYNSKEETEVEMLFRYSYVCVFNLLMRLARRKKRFHILVFILILSLIINR